MSLLKKLDAVDRACLILLVVGGLGLLASHPRKAQARPIGEELVQPVYENDGDTINPIAVTCSSTAWTTVSAKRQARRSLQLMTVTSQLFGVCVGSITTSSDPNTCTDTMPGLEFSTGAPHVPIPLNTEAAIGCRARAGSSGEALKGLELYQNAEASSSIGG